MAKRLLAIMGSGETAPTMIKVHRAIFERVGSGSVPAVMLDTPFGFQANADELVERSTTYFRESVDRTVGVATFRRAEGADPLEVERMRIAIADADLVFAGPGSPSYALRQWTGSPVPGALRDKLEHGGCVLFSSAAALTLGILTVPVYEIYKVGEDPHWLRGFDLTSVTGMSIVVIPHYDNAEGGTHDTRFCYLGEPRLRRLEDEMPEGSFVLGVDEHTAVVLDLDSGSAEVLGRSGVTIRVHGRSRRIEAGTTVPIHALGEIASGVPPTGAVEPVAPAGPPPAAPTASPLRDAIIAAESAFAAAFDGRDAEAAVRVALDLEEELYRWRADTQQSDDVDRGRAAVRSMIVRLGAAAASGITDPRTRAAPWVDALLALRRAARESKRWSDADDVRERLEALGVEVRDGPEGTSWVLDSSGSDRS